MGKSVAEQVQAILHLTKWTQKELAHRLGVSNRAIDFWLRGRGVSATNFLRLEALEDELTSEGFRGTPPTHDGHILAEVRQKLGLSQKELGRRLGIGQAVVSRVENGHISLPGSVREAALEMLREPAAPAQASEPVIDSVTSESMTALSITPQRFAELLRLMEWLQGIPEERIRTLRSLSAVEWACLEGALP